LLYESNEISTPGSEKSSKRGPISGSPIKNENEEYVEQKNALRGLVVI